MSWFADAMVGLRPQSQTLEWAAEAYPTARAAWDSGDARWAWWLAGRFAVSRAERLKLVAIACTVVRELG